MKAGVYYGVEDFRVAEFPEPELKEDGVKIAVKYCGVCGTQISWTVWITSNETASSFRS